MTDVSRRAFIGGVAGAAVAAGAATALADPARATVIPEAKKPKFHALSRDKVYSLKFFRAGKGKQWQIGPMKLRLDKLSPIRTGDGVSRLHEGAFAAVFTLRSGKAKHGGTFQVTAPDGTVFPLAIARITPIQHKGTKYVAVINRWVPVK